MSAPRISVLLPIYKVEDYIEHCLDSLLSQSFTDFEIIAVDDSSPDRSGEIAARLLAQQDRIPWKLIRNTDNKGLAETRKIAASEARGGWARMRSSVGTSTCSCLPASARSSPTAW
ncbi:glycosyltransferase family 2 protein [Paraburkholderia sp. CI3]|uniref:glycosyltransferase family 2 protein n=1 Tax=Paraburkholderia sp. CI3 TaxID=2991060 RepID=UPI003D20F0DE